MTFESWSALDGKGERNTGGRRTRFLVLVTVAFASTESSGPLVERVCYGHCNDNRLQREEIKDQVRGKAKSDGGKRKRKMGRCGDPIHERK